MLKNSGIEFALSLCTLLTKDINYFTSRKGFVFCIITTRKVNGEENKILVVKGVREIW
jgi:hypothetical protein